MPRAGKVNLAKLGSETRGWIGDQECITVRYPPNISITAATHEATSLQRRLPLFTEDEAKELLVRSRFQPGGVLHIGEVAVVRALNNRPGRRIAYISSDHDLLKIADEPPKDATHVVLLKGDRVHAHSIPLPRGQVLNLKRREGMAGISTPA